MVKAPMSTVPGATIGTYPGWWFMAMAEARSKAIMTQRRTKVHVVMQNNGQWGPYVEWTPVMTIA